MFKAISAVAGAAILAFALTFLPGLTAEVEASTPAGQTKADRLDLRSTGKDCSERAWPYFEPPCLRNYKGSRLAVPIQARLVTTDRL